jgi:hypothetical protein
MYDAIYEAEIAFYVIMSINTLCNWKKLNARSQLMGYNKAHVLNAGVLS